jgi:hypothetical protein
VPFVCLIKNNINLHLAREAGQEVTLLQIVVLLEFINHQSRHICHGTRAHIEQEFGSHDTSPLSNANAVLRNLVPNLLICMLD